jgi:YggT family protein
MLVQALVRNNVADYVLALTRVYGFVIIVYVLLNMMFSLGLRPPYSRVVDVVLEFLRDVSEPYLRVFRRFIPPIGMIDLSPMIAIILLFFVGQIAYKAIHT